MPALTPRRRRPSAWDLEPFELEDEDDEPETVEADDEPPTVPDEPPPGWAEP